MQLSLVVEFHPLMLGVFKYIFLEKCNFIYERHLKIIGESDPDVILIWDRCDLISDLYDLKNQKLEWNSKEFWKQKFGNIDFYLKSMNLKRRIVIFILPE